MELQSALKNLGLNEKEAKVYLALLQLGTTTAYSVADRSGLKKPTTYVILGQLVEKGFARNIPRAKKQLFAPESPEDILSVAEEKFLHTKSALPELMALRKGDKEKTNVSYFEKLEGIKQAHDFLIKTMKQKPEEKREYVGFYAHAEDAGPEVVKWFDHVNNEHKRHRIRRKAITVHHPIIINKYLFPEYCEQYFVKVKALDPEKYFSNMEIAVFDRYVLMYSQKYLQAVLIENPDAAAVFLQIFEMVWDLVEKDRKNYVRFSNV